MAERQRFRNVKRWAGNALKSALVIGALSLGDYGIRQSIAEQKQAQLEQMVQQTPEELFPGYYEAKYHIKSEFFGVEGHLPWLREVMEIPELNTIGRSALQEMIDNPNEYQGTGDVLQLMIETTHQQLYSQFPGDIPENLENALENDESRDSILRYSLITHAGILNPFEPDYIKKFGLENTNFDNYPWNLPDGFMNNFRNTGMLYSPETWGGNEYAGIDREVHLAHHAMGSYLLAQSYDYGQNLHYETVPLLGAGTAWLRTNEAFMFAAGLGYETKMTFKFSENDGLFQDKSIWHDLTANKIGRHMGELLTDASAEEVYTLIEMLNSDELQEITEHPQIPTELKQLLWRRIRWWRN